MATIIENNMKNCSKIKNSCLINSTLLVGKFLFYLSKGYNLVLRKIHGKNFLISILRNLSLKIL